MEALRGLTFQVPAGSIYGFLKIAQTADGVRLDFEVVVASYVATWNADRTELVGTYARNDFSAPLTFRQAAPAHDR